MSPVGFVPNIEETPGTFTKIWWLYGNYAEVNQTGVLFYAKKAQEDVDVWQLLWRRVDLAIGSYSRSSKIDSTSINTIIIAISFDVVYLNY